MKTTCQHCQMSIRRMNAAELASLGFAPGAVEYTHTGSQIAFCANGVDCAEPKDSERSASAPRAATRCIGRCKQVDPRISSAVRDAINEWRDADPTGERGIEAMLPPNAELQAILAPKMAAQNLRFCACFRHEVTPSHSLIYWIVASTVSLNVMADQIAEAA